MDQDHGHRLNNFGWDHRRAWVYPQIEYISSIEYIQSSPYFYLLASFGWSVTIDTIEVLFFFKFELLKAQLFGNFQMYLWWSLCDVPLVEFMYGVFAMNIEIIYLKNSS